MENPMSDKRPETSPSELMRVLNEDLHQLRVGNSAPETVPVFSDGAQPGDRFVRFADLSVNVRRILDLCPEVEIRVDGDRYEGVRAWREISGWRSPVLEWREPKS
jgi:hypothetical protein